MADWHNDLPEELATDPTIRKYETPLDAHKALVAANARLGNSIRIVGPDGEAEDREKFLTKLVAAAPELTRLPDPTDDNAMKEHRRLSGVPETKSGYDNPEGFKGVPDEILEGMQEFAFAAGLSKKQYQSVITSMADMHETEQNAIVAAADQTEAALKAQWGLSYDERIAITNNVAKQFAPEGAELDMTPETRMTLFSMAEAMAGRGPQAHFQPHAPVQQVDPLEAQEQIDELRKKMANPDNRSDYKTMMARMTKLQQLAHPQRAPA